VRASAQADVVYLESGLPKRSRPTEGESPARASGEALRSHDRWGRKDGDDAVLLRPAHRVI